MLTSLWPDTHSSPPETIMGTKARPLDGSNERIIAESICAPTWVDDGKGGTSVCLCLSVCCLSSLLCIHVSLSQTAAVFQTTEDEHKTNYDGRDNANRILHFLIIFQVCFLASQSDSLMELPVVSLNLCNASLSDFNKEQLVSLIQHRALSPTTWWPRTNLFFTN